VGTPSSTGDLEHADSAQTVCEVSRDFLQAHHADVTSIPWRVVVAASIGNPEDGLAKNARVFEREPHVALLRKNHRGPRERQLRVTGKNHQGLQNRGGRDTWKDRSRPPSANGTEESDSNSAPVFKLLYPRSAGVSKGVGDTWPKRKGLVEMTPLPGSSGKRSMA